MQVIYLHGNAPIPELPTELIAHQPMVNKLLAKEPAQRFPSARELINDITRLEAELA
jgi:hypothetical protein